MVLMQQIFNQKKAMDLEIPRKGQADGSLLHQGTNESTSQDAIGEERGVRL